MLSSLLRTNLLANNKSTIVVNNNDNQILKDFCWSFYYSSQIVTHYAEEYEIETIVVINNQLISPSLEVSAYQTTHFNRRALQIINSIMPYKTAITKHVLKGIEMLKLLSTCVKKCNSDITT